MSEKDISYRFDSKIEYCIQIQRCNNTILDIFSEISKIDKNASITTIDDPIKEGIFRNLIKGFFPFRFEIFFYNIRELHIIILLREDSQSFNENIKQDYSDFQSIYPFISNLKKNSDIFNINLKSQFDDTFNIYSINIKSDNYLQKHSEDLSIKDYTDIRNKKIALYLKREQRKKAKKEEDNVDEGFMFFRLF